MTLPETAASIVDRLALAPHGEDVALVLRHDEREAIPRGAFGEDVRLTADGVGAATTLGSRLSARELSALRASPLPRCLQTAEAVVRGDGWAAEAVPNHLLGDPSPFVTDASVFGPLFLEVGIRELVRRQLADRRPPPDMRDTGEGVMLLLDTVAGELGHEGRLHVHVSHDAILAVLVGHLFRLGVDDFCWPGYLCGLLIWRRDGQLHFPWKDSGRPRTHSAVRRMASAAVTLAR